MAEYIDSNTLSKLRAISILEVAQSFGTPEIHSLCDICLPHRHELITYKYGFSDIVVLGKYFLQHKIYQGTINRNLGCLIRHIIVNKQRLLILRSYKLPNREIPVIGKNINQGLQSGRDQFSKDT